MAPRDIVVVGASAGGIEPLIAIAAGLPSAFEASLFVVLHVPAQGTSVLPRILARAGPLPAYHVTDGMPCLPGCIYVAPPDRHLVLDAEGMHISLGPRENGHRPAADTLFRSAARAYGPRVVGVVLSGSGDDGTAGLLAVQRAGGVTVVQDPTDASCPSMPRRAAELVSVDFSLPATDIPLLLQRLSRGEDPKMHDQPFAPAAGMPVEIAADYARSEQGPDAPSLSGFSCPECGGRLWEFEDAGMFRYRCRVGHGYSPESLMTLNTEALEGALWSALNVLEENAALSRRLALDARNRNHVHTATRFEQKASDTEAQAKLLRQVLDLKLREDAPQIETVEEQIASPQGILRKHVVNQSEHS